MGTNEYIDEVFFFCFTVFLGGFLFRVRGRYLRVRVRDRVGDGSRVRFRVRATFRAR